jgi:peptidoglycan biosynthesis protein MviN/MurJ (putative lipid II flippase)
MSFGLASKLRAKLANAHPDHRRIAKGAAWVSLFVLMGKSAGAFKEMAIAYRYGVSGIVDAYQLSFTLATWIPSMLVTVLSTVLIPVLVRMRNDDTDTLANFIGELRGLAWLVGLAIANVLVFASPVVIAYVGGPLPEHTRSLAMQFIVGMSPLVPLTLLMCIDAARLQARERHINTLLEAVPAAVLFFVVILSTGSSIKPLYMAVTLGLALQVYLLSMFARRADKVRAPIRFGFSSPQWRAMAHSIGVMLVSQAILACIVPIDQYMATREGAGAVATLGYANRLIALLMGLGASAIGRATLPVLTQTIRNGERERARSMAIKWAYVMFGIGAVAACVASFAAPLIVRVLFQRGAFTAVDTEHVAVLLRWFTLQLAPAFATLVLMQMAASEGRYRSIAFITCAGFVAKVAANFAFTPMLGLAALPVGTAVMAGVVFVLYLFSIHENEEEDMEQEHAA